MSDTFSTDVDDSPLALVTGAAGIIGPAITRKLRSAGWRVVATDQHSSHFDLYEKAFGESVEADEIIPADLVSQESCVALIREIEDRHGGLSAIIHAAVINARQPFSEVTEDTAARHFAVNVLAAIFLAQTARHSLAKNKGSLIHFSSVMVEKPRKGGLLYACSKAALEKATEEMAWELREDGVRVNCLRVGKVPGYEFLRDTIRDLPDSLARKLVRDLLAERTAEMERQYGTQGVGRPEDVAQTVAFLLSRAARFINGRIIALDGGFCPEPEGCRKSVSFATRISDWLERNATRRK